MAEKTEINEALNIMVDRCNELYDITQDKNAAPMAAGRAAWERKGILFAIKTIAAATGEFNFEKLFEGGVKADNNIDSISEL